MKNKNYEIIKKKQIAETKKERVNLSILFGSVGAKIVDEHEQSCYMDK